MNVCPSCLATCAPGVDCSKFPKNEVPSSFPPYDLATMLSMVLQPYDKDQSTCPLSPQGDVAQQCFLNGYGPKTGTCNPPCDPGFFCNNGTCEAASVFMSSGSMTDAIGVDKFSFAPGCHQCDQYYLTQPGDNLKLSNIQFIVSPPGSQPCSGSMDSCNVPNGDGTVRCDDWSGAMPCLPGLSPQKAGPCLSHPDWQGWTLQGYQCIPTFFECDVALGNCQPSPTGTYTNEDDCNKNCTVCPSQGFNLYTMPDGTSRCYRNPYVAVKDDNWSDGHNICGYEPGNACGEHNLWTPWFSGEYSDCLGNPGGCSDGTSAPYLSYQCTPSGYVQCLNKSGCPAVGNITINFGMQCGDGTQRDFNCCIPPAGATLVRRSSRENADLQFSRAFL